MEMDEEKEEEEEKEQSERELEKRMFETDAVVTMQENRCAFCHKTESTRVTHLYVSVRKRI